MSDCGGGEFGAENEEKDLDDIVKALEVGEIGMIAENLGNDI